MRIHGQEEYLLLFRTTLTEPEAKKILCLDVTTGTSTSLRAIVNGKLKEEKRYVPCKKICQTRGLHIAVL